MTRHPFTPGRFRHPSCLDMDLEILKVSYAGPDYVEARAFYINRQYQGGDMVLWPRVVTVKLVKEHWYRWRRIK